MGLAPITCPSGYSASAFLLLLNITSMVLSQELCTSARNPLPTYNLMATSLISLTSLLNRHLAQRPTLTPLLNSTTWLFLPSGKQMAPNPILIGTASIYASKSSKLSCPSLKSQKNFPKSFPVLFIGLTWGWRNFSQSLATECWLIPFKWRTVLYV